MFRKKKDGVPIYNHPNTRSICLATYRVWPTQPIIRNKSIPSCKVLMFESITYPLNPQKSQIQRNWLCKRIRYQPVRI